ncbi:SubName: Full=Uncharacterized protein {ECO:0000313/EMBL:CCA74886.1} [Serendipita indica DSM 11827]|nr:SubName: Full=Uncharacterized protein {ECO:0000313/EMBL:CCA74886.1} [Serendipita indica DSM 11827]
MNDIDSGVAKGGTLLFTFKPLDRIGLKQKKVAWKVIPFAANAKKRAQVEYVNQLAFIAPQVSGGNRIDPSTYEAVNVGDAVSYDLDGDGQLVINEADDLKRPDFITARNNTRKIQDIAIGLQPKPRKDPEPILYFPKVGNTTMVVAKYHPILRAYMTSDYQESEVISGEIQTGLMWERDLSQLPDTSSWILTYDDDSGMYNLAPDDDN